MFSRRDFLTTVACGTAAAATRPVWAGAGEPLFRFGLLTDTHVTHRERSAELVALAMKVFRDRKCNAIIHCGDLCDMYYPEGFRYYRAAVEKSFPRDMKNRPEFLYVHAGHDIIDPVASRAPGHVGLCSLEPNDGFARMDRALEDTVFPHFLQREFAGHPVLIFPQDLGLIGGYKAVDEKIGAATAAHPGKRVIVCFHAPPGYTTYESGTNGVLKKILDKYPMVVSFNGHIHNTVRNERCIWSEGGFTEVDVGCLQFWYGMTPGTLITAKRAHEVLVTEIYPGNEFVIRRFDVRDGSEIKPLHPWTVPLKRAKEAPGAFAPGAQAGIWTDAVPYKTVTVRFPTVQNEDDLLAYRVEAFQGGRRVARCETFSEFYLHPTERKHVLEASVSAAFFDGGDYRFTVTPVGFLGTEGCPLEIPWTAPAKAPTRLVWQVAKPMEELTFREGYTTTVEAARKSTADVAVKDGWVKRRMPLWAVLPESIWHQPKGTLLRFTADLEFERGEPPGTGLEFNLRAADGSKRHACKWQTTPPDVAGAFRIVFDFPLNEPDHPYQFMTLSGPVGRLRINAIRLEALD